MLGSLTSSYTHGDGREVLLETGLLANQADGAVVVTSGDTQVLVTVVASNDVRAEIDFFPLTVDVEERMYAVGKIPGSFFRREGRPTEKAILSARLIDRPLRPNFDDGFRNEIQIIATILSADQIAQPDVMAINGASAALLIAGIPFSGPIGAVRLARIGAEWVPNPMFQELDQATFDLVVAGRRNGSSEIEISMIEAGATDNAFDLIAAGAPDVTEEVVAGGFEEAKAHIAASCDAQLALRDLVNPPAREFRVFPEYSQEIYERVVREVGDKLAGVLRLTGKADRELAERVLRDDVIAALVPGGEEDQVQDVKAAFRALVKKAVRRRVVDEGIRMDGRRNVDLRPLTARVGLVKRAHGSGLFQRGETQVLTVTTLGMLRMAQTLDTIGVEESKRYMHNYNFPPFSTGETGRVGAPRRREIGHGALVERALLPVVPREGELPYALRVVSEVLSSNGSTSMGSVCASTLSLMDCGVQIKAPVAGISIGLVAEDGKFVHLTDILGAEDAYGEMDFKVAGTRTTVTAIQLDIKARSLPSHVLAAALGPARDARHTILDLIEETLGQPRSELSAFAPRIISIQIPVDKIGEVIGPKGKVINEIQGTTGANIDVQDDGTIHIGGIEASAVEAARTWIDNIVNPPRAEIGARYKGKVVNITKFGAFVNILPGRDGLLHISKLGMGRRVDRVEDVLSLGDEVEVLVEDIDRQDRVSLRPVGDEKAAEAPEGDFDEDDWEDEEFEEEFEEAPAQEPARELEPVAAADRGRRRRRRRASASSGEREREKPVAATREAVATTREAAASPPRREQVSFEDDFERRTGGGAPRRRGR